jgi:hypothetical protein
VASSRGAKDMVTAYAKFIRERYTVTIIATLVLGIVVGLFTPAPGIAIRKISTFLIVVMIGAMGSPSPSKALERLPGTGNPLFSGWS